MSFCIGVKLGRSHCGRNVGWGFSRYALYSSPNIIRVIKSSRKRWAGHVGRMGTRRGAQRVLVGKPERRRPLERARSRWEDNIKMDLREEVRVHILDRSGSRQGQVARSCECGNEPSGSINAWNFLNSWGPLTFSGRTCLHGVIRYKTAVQWQHSYFLFGRYQVKISAGDGITRELSWPTSALQITPQPFLFTSYPVYYSLFILSLSATQAELLDMSINKEAGATKHYVPRWKHNERYQLLTFPTSCTSCSCRSCDKVWCRSASCSGVSPSLSGMLRFDPSRTSSCKMTYCQ